MFFVKTIFSEITNKGNKTCSLNVLLADGEYHLVYTALGRTNPRDGKRERFTIFDETYDFASIEELRTSLNKLPIHTTSDKFRPLADCFAILTNQFLSAIEEQ